MNFVLYDGQATWDASGKSTDSSPPQAETVPPTVQVVATDYFASLNGDGSSTNPGVFVFWRNGDTNADLTVYYTPSGTATNGVDYETLPGSVTIPAGASYSTVRVTPINNGVNSGLTPSARGVQVTLEPDAAYSIGSLSNASVIIVLSQYRPERVWYVALYAIQDTTSENGPEPGVFIVSRGRADFNSGHPDPPLTVAYRLGGTARNGVDYETLSGTVTILEGATFATVTVRPMDDNVFKGTRTVTIEVASGPSDGYGPGNPNQATVFIRDNDPPPAKDKVWVNDDVPAGAWTGADGGDAWNWLNKNPTPFHGALDHQSSLAPGIHYHYFADATDRLTVNPGDTLVACVFLDPVNPPREIMLQWFDGTSWEHRAYWGGDLFGGGNLITWGADGTASRRPMGLLPPAGQWVRLEVPAGAVDLEGRAISGMNFILYDGQAAWDYAGKASP